MASSWLTDVPSLKSVKMAAPESWGPMLRDDGGCCQQIDLLNHSRRLTGGGYLVTAIRTGIERVIPEVVNFVFPKWTPLMPRVARLGSTLSLLPGFFLRTARFCNVTGRRLGGVRRILFELRDSCFEFGNLLLEPLAFRTLVFFALRRHNSGQIPKKHRTAKNQFISR